VRRLIGLLVVLLVLVVGADRGGAVLAAHVVASKLKTSASLATEPAVTIHGVPFLTQAFSGRYDDVELKIVDLARGGVRLATLDVALRGVRLPLADAISGQVSSVPVDGITATAVVTYADIALRGAIAGLSVQPAGSLVKVTGRITVLGQSVTASAESTVRLDGGNLVVTAQKVSVLGQSSGVLNGALAGRLDLRVPIGTLPYGLKLTGVHATDAGVVLDARSGATVLRVRA
jgi:hypothetical protein